MDIKCSNKELIIKNKGTGAGGSKTNANGLPYEKLTDLSLNIVNGSNINTTDKIKFTQCETPFVSTKQSNFLNI